MSDALRHAVENRREQLIHALIEHEIYKKDGKHLFELTLSELEHEYRYVRSVNRGGKKLPTDSSFLAR